MVEFKFDECFWVAEARLPSWSGFQTRRGAYGAVSSDQPSDGTVEVTFAPEGRDDAPLTPAELALVQWLLDNEKAVADSLLTGLLAAYPSLQGEYGYDEDEKREFMPDLVSVEGFRPIIGLYNVNVHQVERDGVPYLGFEFGCSWDDEHGLGVLMHGTRIVEIGQADTAILLWVAKRDADKEP